MKSLIIYYSHIGENYFVSGITNITKGNTQRVAEFIKQITNSDIFEIQPVKEYSSNYKECCKQAKKELDNKIYPQLKEYIKDISKYDVIYIGGPIWYGTYPMAVYSLLKELDFSNKIIKPFSTHEGSGLGNIINDLSLYCKNSIIKPGLSIQGSYISEYKDKIKEWIVK